MGVPPMLGEIRKRQSPLGRGLLVWFIATWFSFVFQPCAMAFQNGHINSSSISISSPDGQMMNCPHCQDIEMKASDCSFEQWSDIQFLQTKEDTVKELKTEKLFSPALVTIIQPSDLSSLSKSGLPPNRVTLSLTTPTQRFDILRL